MSPRLSSPCTDPDLEVGVDDLLAAALRLERKHDYRSRMLTQTRRGLCAAVEAALATAPKLFAARDPDEFCHEAMRLSPVELRRLLYIAAEGWRAERELRCACECREGGGGAS